MVTSALREERRVTHSNRGHVITSRYATVLIIIIILSGVRVSPHGTAATIGLLHQPQMTDDGDCVAISGIKIGRVNQSTRRKPAPTPLCPPQIPHDQTRARTGPPRWETSD
jgi:hypothetical protein